ncbi:MAG: hypothetical protein O3A30_03960 [Bacteroidetes bacterium]|nr:hypothetical protein [Bacteroidota bacterium]
MSYRTTDGSNYRLYDAAADLLASEQELAKIMAIAGMDVTSMESTTIDEILGAIAETFCYDDRRYLIIEGETSVFYSFPSTASNDMIQKTSSTLITIARRMWRSRHLANYRMSS